MTNPSQSGTAAEPVGSPVETANPQSLSELFSRDPEDLQSNDLDTITAELRRMRVKWQTDEAAGKKSTRKSPTQKEIIDKTALAAANAAIDLDDLGL